jgi:hypothetical protein
MSYRNKKLLNAARDQACQLCGRNDGTTVAAHVRSVQLGSGTSIKAPDCLTAWLCHECHDGVDGRRGNLNKEERERIWFVAFAKTVVQWFEQGIVEVR